MWDVAVGCELSTVEGRSEELGELSGDLLGVSCFDFVSDIGLGLYMIGYNRRSATRTIRSKLG